MKGLCRLSGMNRQSVVMWGAGGWGLGGARWGWGGGRRVLSQVESFRLHERDTNDQYVVHFCVCEHVSTPVLTMDNIYIQMYVYRLCIYNKQKSTDI